MGLIQLSEDCHNLNVIRPKRESEDRELLPVMVWIFGGGWQQGATADPRYLLLFLQGTRYNIGANEESTDTT
jgi:triacylglycerol lipase